MANTLTNLAPDLYAALDVVSRELVGLIPAVSRDSNMDRAALNQTIRSFQTPVAACFDVVPGQLPADNGDQTVSNIVMTISRSKYVPIRWAGEEQKGVDTGPGYRSILQDQFTQGMRTLTNFIEADLASLFPTASRAIGPAGTTLFDAANYKDIANARKILADNGAPLTDLHAILNTTAGAALRGLAQYTGAMEAGTTDILRQGVLLDVHGVAMRESAQIKSTTVGTASGSTTTAAGFAIGATVIAIAAAGTGTIIPGDVITFAGDTNKYVVASGLASAAAGGSITIGAPGLLKAIPTSATAITVNSSGTDKNMVFARNAIHLITRVPARPQEGDLAEDVMIIQDPVSGLAFEIAQYREYRRVKYEVSCCWGFQTIKSEHLALLLGP